MINSLKRKILQKKQRKVLEKSALSSPDQIKRESTFCEKQKSTPLIKTHITAAKSFKNSNFKMTNDKIYHSWDWHSWNEQKNLFMTLHFKNLKTKFNNQANFASTIYSNQKHMTLQVLTIANCRIKLFFYPQKHPEWINLFSQNKRNFSNFSWCRMSPLRYREIENLRINFRLREFQ